MVLTLHGRAFWNVSVVMSGRRRSSGGQIGEVVGLALDRSYETTEAVAKGAYTCSHEDTELTSSSLSLVYCLSFDFSPDIQLSSGPTALRTTKL